MVLVEEWLNREGLWGRALKVHWKLYCHVCLELMSNCAYRETNLHAPFTFLYILWADTLTAIFPDCLFKDVCIVEQLCKMEIVSFSGAKACLFIVQCGNVSLDQSQADIFPIIRDSVSLSSKFLFCSAIP